MHASNYLATISAVLLGPCVINAHSFNISSSFRIDVHSHVVPDFYEEALIQGGYAVENGTVYTDGFPVPSWDVVTHIESMDLNSINYSTLSVSAPGVSFLAADEEAAGALARKLNLAMSNYTKTYPTRLGAMCVLPLPHVQLALIEIDVSMTPVSRLRYSM